MVEMDYALRLHREVVNVILDHCDLDCLVAFYWQSLWMGAYGEQVRKEINARKEDLKKKLGLSLGCSWDLKFIARCIDTRRIKSRYGSDFLPMKEKIIRSPYHADIVTQLLIQEGIHALSNEMMTAIISSGDYASFEQIKCFFKMKVMRNFKDTECTWAKDGKLFYPHSELRKYLTLTDNTVIGYLRFRMEYQDPEFENFIKKEDIFAPYVLEENFDKGVIPRIFDLPQSDVRIDDMNKCRLLLSKLIRCARNKQPGIAWYKALDLVMNILLDTYDMRTVMDLVYHQCSKEEVEAIKNKYGQSTDFADDWECLVFRHKHRRGGCSVCKT